MPRKQHQLKRKTRSEDAWEFAVKEIPAGFLVVVKTFTGENPVGPRLLRGVPIQESCLEGVYPTQEDALKAARKWAEYTDEFVLSGRASENRTKARKMGAV